MEKKILDIIDRTPGHRIQQPKQSKRRPRRRDTERVGEKRQRGNSPRAIEPAEKTLRPRLDKRRQGDGELADPEPADPPIEVRGHRRVGDGLETEVAEEHGVFAPAFLLFFPRVSLLFKFLGQLPERVADQVVFADVV